MYTVNLDRLLDNGCPAWLVSSMARYGISVRSFTKCEC